MIRVFIVADTRLYREGLSEIIARNDRIEVVGTAACRDEALANVGRSTPDILLLDLGTPEALSVISEIRASTSHVRIIALGAPEADSEILACAKAGVSSFVQREASLEELVSVVECVAKGGAVCSPRATAILLRGIATLPGSLDYRPAFARLTAREQEIMRLLANGWSNKEIANELGIEITTTKNHVHNILEKLMVRRRGEAAAFWRRSNGPSTRAFDRREPGIIAAGFGRR